MQLRKRHKLIMLTGSQCMSKENGDLNIIVMKREHYYALMMNSFGLHPNWYYFSLKFYKKPIEKLKKFNVTA